MMSSFVFVACGLVLLGVSNLPSSTLASGVGLKRAHPLFGKCTSSDRFVGTPSSEVSFLQDAASVPSDSECLQTLAQTDALSSVALNLPDDKSDEDGTKKGSLSACWVLYFSLSYALFVTVYHRFDWSSWKWGLPPDEVADFSLSEWICVCVRADGRITKTSSAKEIISQALSVLSGEADLDAAQGNATLRKIWKHMKDATEESSLFVLGLGPELFALSQVHLNTSIRCHQHGGHRLDGFPGGKKPIRCSNYCDFS
ncbi:hypothetical protein ACSSS7_002183 [Eimeria intestinalis]